MSIECLIWFFSRKLVTCLFEPFFFFGKPWFSQEANSCGSDGFLLFLVITKEGVPTFCTVSKGYGSSQFAHCAHSYGTRRTCDVRTHVEIWRWMDWLTVSLAVNPTWTGWHPRDARRRPPAREGNVCRRASEDRRSESQSSVLCFWRSHACPIITGRRLVIK
jgi:hypothetical protein